MTDGEILILIEIPDSALAYNYLVGTGTARADTVKAGSAAAPLPAASTSGYVGASVNSSSGRSV